MVYESDFYTTRRPYHRPTVTSYSVTNSRLTPAVGKAHTYHPSIPFIAHKKLTNVTTPVPHNQVRKSVIGNTLDRIQHRVRPLQSYDPMEDFLNERSVTSFEDVTRSIRANTAALLKKVHTPIPRAIKPLSVSNLYNHTEAGISDRISSDEYIWHLLRPLPGKPSNGIDVGYYPETSTRIPLGKTHLACLSYAGGHPISKRRQLVAGAGDDYRNVRNDVELLSHYTRMRDAANHPHENGGVRNERRNDGANHFKYNATTTPHTTEEVITNGASSASESDKENIASNYQKPLKKKPSKESSIDEDRVQIERENALKAKKAEEERLERLEQDRKAEEERLEQERKAEEERLEQERLEQERIEEERKAEEKRLAEEERLEQERIAEEERLEQERLAKEEEEQRLLEEKLVEEYHREQEKLAEEQRIRELEYAEEQQRLAQEKLAEEQQLLHDKLMEIKQKQEAEEEDVEKEEETEQSAAVDDEIVDKVEENDSEYVTCNNIPKDDTENKNESADESEESDEEEPAIAENVQQNGSIEIEETVHVKFSIKSSTGHEYNTKKAEEDDEKSENTDANSEISENEEQNNTTVPELNHVESKENDAAHNNSKENKEESEEEEEEEDEEEEEEEEEE